MATQTAPKTLYWLPKTTPTEGAKPMTLAVSIRAQAGVILCAESQITEGQSKFNEMKIDSVVCTPTRQFAIVGAGWWDYVKMAYEELQTALLDREEEDSSQVIKSVITGLYENQIRAYPSDYEKPRISLLMAVAGRDSLSVTKSVDTAVHSALPFDAIGVGQDLARYIGSKLYGENLSSEQAAALGAYVLEEAKRNVEGCGGITQILWLGTNGVKSVSDAKLTQLRSWFARKGMPDLKKMPKELSPVLHTDVRIDH